MGELLKFSFVVSCHLGKNLILSFLFIPVIIITFNTYVM